MNSNTSIKHVGYIGMGIMGSAMAANLLKAGFQVTVWNRTRARCQKLAELGAQVADSIRDLLARQPQVICVNVTDTPDVRQVLLGETGVASYAPAGMIVVDHSTINPVATQQMAGELKAKDIIMLDAPVSGGDVGARNGTLSIMVGGEEKAFHRCLPMFQAMGKTITHLGPSGMGQVCKAANQAIVACTLMGVCEAMALSKQNGLDIRKMIQVVSAGAGGSWQLANLGPKIAEGDMAPGFMIDLVLKDMDIVIQSAKAKGLAMNGTQAARQYFAQAKQLGAGRLGTQAMSKALEHQGEFRFAGD